MSGRLSILNNPLLLGFDHIERTLEQVAKSSGEGYPPYNIEQRGEGALRITIAVAGFAASDLAVTVEDSQLVIRGRQTPQDDDRLYLHRGIAARQFQRIFLLAEGMEVRDAQLKDGLLHVDLQQVLPESSVRTIEIRSDGVPPSNRKALQNK